MKKRFKAMYMPHPTMPPKKKNKQKPPQLEPQEVETLPEELNERPNAEHYGFGPISGPFSDGPMPCPGWGGDMAPRWPLAEARVPWQQYGQVFNPVIAVEKGTIFPELYRPYPD